MNKTSIRQAMSRHTHDVVLDYITNNPGKNSKEILQALMVKHNRTEFTIRGAISYLCTNGFVCMSMRQYYPFDARSARQRRGAN